MGQGVVTQNPSIVFVKVRVAIVHKSISILVFYITFKSEMV